VALLIRHAGKPDLAAMERAMRTLLTQPRASRTKPSHCAPVRREPGRTPAQA
jgi:hypothetical protein